MSEKSTDSQIDMEALTKVFLSIDDWENIDGLFVKALKSGVYGRSLHEKAFEIAAKYLTRGAIKRIKIKDVEGNVVDFVASIVMTDKSSGKPHRVYKLVSVFEVGDFVQVTGYRKGVVRKNAKMVLMFIKIAVAKFGEQVRDLLPSVDHLLDGISDDPDDEDFTRDDDDE